MRATGLFFLRTRPYTARASDGTQVLMLPVVEHDERDGKRVLLNELLAVWRGAEADRFWALHFPELKPGRGLDLELDRMRWDGREWRAHVTACRLAPMPPSWIKHEQATATAEAGTTEPPPPQPLAA